MHNDADKFNLAMDSVLFDILHSNNPLEYVAQLTIEPHIFDATLQARGDGWRLALYNQVLRDPHAGAVFAKRRQAVTSKPYRFTPATDRRADQRAATDLAAWAARRDFRGLCDWLLDASVYGITAAELAWIPTTRPGTPAELHWRGITPERILVETDTARTRIATIHHPQHGELLPPRKIVTHAYNSGGGAHPYGRGLGSPLWWLIHFKKLLTRYWLEAAARFGAPTVVMQTPSTDESIRKQAAEAGAALKSSGYIVAPPGAVPHLMEASANNGQIFAHLAAYIDKLITLRVLGESLTTDVGSVGSHAAATVHNEVRVEVAAADAAALADTINSTLVTWWCQINYPEKPVTPPHVQFDLDQPKTTAAALAEIKTAAELGYEPDDPESVMTEIIGRPMRQATLPLPDPDDPDDPE